MSAAPWITSVGARTWREGQRSACARWVGLSRNSWWANLGGVESIELVEVGPRNLAGIPAEACKAKRPRCFVIDQPWNRPVLHSPLSMRRSPASAPAPRTRKCAPGRTSMVLSTLGGDTDVSKSSGMCRSWTRPATFAPTPMALHLVVG